MSKVDWPKYLESVHARRPDKQPPHLMPSGCFRRVSGNRWLVVAEIIPGDMIARHPHIGVEANNVVETDNGLPLYRVHDSIARTRRALRMVMNRRKYARGLNG